MSNEKKRAMEGKMESPTQILQLKDGYTFVTVRGPGGKGMEEKYLDPAGKEVDFSEIPAKKIAELADEVAAIHEAERRAAGQIRLHNQKTMAEKAEQTRLERERMDAFKAGIAAWEAKGVRDVENSVTSLSPIRGAEKAAPTDKTQILDQGWIAKIRKGLFGEK